MVKNLNRIAKGWKVPIFFFNSNPVIANYVPTTDLLWKMERY